MKTLRPLVISSLLAERRRVGGDLNGAHNRSRPEINAKCGWFPEWPPGRSFAAEEIKAYQLSRSDLSRVQDASLTECEDAFLSDVNYVFRSGL